MKKTKRKNIDINSKAQAAINRIVLRDLHRLRITADQRIAIAVALLAPRLTQQARQRMLRGKKRV
jgi:hypothetical protein